jgi:hypothetical protein
MTDRDPERPGDSNGRDLPDTADVEQEADPGWPWSFILLVVAGAIYLIFRFGELAIKVLN